MLHHQSVQLLDLHQKLILIIQQSLQPQSQVLAVLIVLPILLSQLDFDLALQQA